jgi:hypothetical protein
MPRNAHAILVVAALALPLAGCESINNFDPSDWVPGDIFNTKKKLQGERKPVFPEGVPGLAHGVPPELMNPPPAPGSDAVRDLPPPARGAAVEPEPEPKARPKARPKAPPKQAPASAPEPSTPTAVTVRPSSAPPPQQQQQAPQWPDPPGTQRAPGGGGVQWPDPPAPR